MKLQVSAAIAAVSLFLASHSPVRPKGRTLPATVSDSLRLGRPIPEPREMERQDLEGESVIPLFAWTD